MIQFIVRLRPFLFVVASLFGCGATAPPAAKSIANASREHSAAERIRLEQRELPALAQWRLALEWLTGASEATEPLHFDDGPASLGVVIPIGTEATIRCFLSKSTEHSATESIGRTIESASSNVKVRSLRTSNVAMVAGHSALFVDMIYDNADPNGREPGELKFLFYDGPAAPMVCMHDEMGYRATFERITTRFAASLRVKKGDLPSVEGTEKLGRLERVVAPVEMTPAIEMTPATENGALAPAHP